MESITHIIRRKKLRKIFNDSKNFGDSIELVESRKFKSHRKTIHN